MDNIGIMTWSMSGGGAERAAANLSKDLSDYYNVYIFCFDTSKTPYPYKGQIIDVGIAIGKGLFQKTSILIQRIILIRALKKKYNLKVMISFMPQMNAYNVATRKREKVIISIRNNMTEKHMSKMSNILVRLTGKFADCTVSLSEGVRNDLIENFGFRPDKVITIYNSCDINWFLKKDQFVDELSKDYDFSSPVIASVGRLTYQKGQWHLLRAFSLVKEQIDNCQLLLFGQGELMEDLKRYSEKLGINRDVHFMGFVKNHHYLMEQCDVFVFPSLFEGLGNVLLEAIACEMPVISTDCPSGPREILSDNAIGMAKDIDFSDYGILISPFSKKPFDVNDLEFERSDYLLADAILQILSDNNLKEEYKERAVKRAEFFKPQNIVRKWIDIIEEEK